MDNLGRGAGGVIDEKVSEAISLELGGISDRQLVSVFDELEFVSSIAGIDPGWVVDYAPWSRPTGDFPTREAYSLGISSQVEVRVRFVVEEMRRRGMEV